MQMDAKTIARLAKALRPVMQEHGATLRAVVLVAKDLIPALQADPKLADLVSGLPAETADWLEAAEAVLDIAG